MQNVVIPNTNKGDINKMIALFYGQLRAARKKWICFGQELTLRDSGGYSEKMNFFSKNAVKSAGWLKKFLRETYFEKNGAGSQNSKIYLDQHQP